MRKETRLRSSIWTDSKFIQMSAGTQRLYWLLHAQADVSLCGVLSLGLTRWAALAGDTSPKQIEQALASLEQFGSVQTDKHTGEVWLCDFIETHQILRSPKLFAAAKLACETIISKTIRKSVSVLLGLPYEEESEEVDEEIQEPLTKKRVRPHRIPEDFTPTDRSLEWARDNVPLVDLKSETQRFVNYYVHKGSTGVDWNRAWQNWMLKASSSGYNSRPAPYSTTTKRSNLISDILEDIS